MVSHDCCTSTTSSTCTSTNISIDSADYYIYYDTSATASTATSTCTTTVTCDRCIWEHESLQQFEISDHDIAPWSTGLKETKEEKAARIKKKKVKQQAEEKAVKLLESLIGDEIEVYKKTGRIFVKGKKGTYIVRKGKFVQKIENDKIIDLCVHIKSSYKCPKTDNVIALKMLLENDEDHVLKLANRMGSESLPEELPLAACM